MIYGLCIQVNVGSSQTFSKKYSEINTKNLQYNIHVILAGMYIKKKVYLKGVLHPNTKISMFCLFSPSSRRKLILICMIVIDMCDSKSKSMAIFSWIYESLMLNH